MVDLRAGGRERWIVRRWLRGIAIAVGAFVVVSAVLVGIGVIFLVVVIGPAFSRSTDDHPESSARPDIHLASCTLDLAGHVTATGSILNRSSETSDYGIHLVLGHDRRVYDATYARMVRPGGTR